MNDLFDVKIERINAIKEILLKLIALHQTSTSSSRADWVQTKIDILLGELTRED